MKKYFKPLSYFIIIIFIIFFIFYNKKTSNEDLSQEDLISIKNYLIESLLTENEHNKYFEKVVDRNYNGIFIEIYENGERVLSYGNTHARQNEKASRDIFLISKKILSNKKFKKEKINNYDIFISFFYKENKINPNVITKIPFGVYTLGISNGENNKIILPLDQFAKNFTVFNSFEFLCKELSLDKYCYKENKYVLYLYETKTYLIKNSKIIEFFRGNSLVKITTSLNKDDILKILKEANNWKDLNTNKDGLIEYFYYPTIKETEANINHIRQIAAQISALKVKKKLGDKNTLQIKKAIDFYKKYLVCNANYCYLSIKDNDSLNLTVFYYFLLKEYDSSYYLELLEKLRWGVLLHLDTDGSFYSDINLKTTDNSGIAPGEGMFALIDSYKQTKNKIFLESYDKAFNYYSDFWRQNHFFFIHWISQSLYLAYEQTNNNKYADLLFSMNNWIIESNMIKKSNYIDELGGIKKENPSNLTAVIGEGLLDAYKLAKILKYEKREIYYKEALLKMSKFISLLQYDDVNSSLFTDKEKILGGFRSSLSSNVVSNDFFIHIIGFYTKALDYGLYN